MDTNGLSTSARPDNRIEEINCFICNGTFTRRMDLYLHFESEHNISQAFRFEQGDNIDPPNAVCSRTITEHKRIDTIQYKQITEPSSLKDHFNRMNETLPNTQLPKDPHSIEPAVTSSSREHSLPSSHENLPEQITVTEPDEGTFSKPMGTLHYYPTFADLNTGVTRFPPPSPWIYYRPTNFYHTISEAAQTDLYHTISEASQTSLNVGDQFCQPQLWQPFGDAMGSTVNKDSMNRIHNGHIKDVVHEAITFTSNPPELFYLRGHIENNPADVI